MHEYRKLKVWQRSHGLMKDIYGVTRNFPPEERFALRVQLQKAALSIPSNIAEGSGRFSRAEYRRFVEFASGSSFEVDYQLFAAHDLGYIDDPTYERLTPELLEIQKMLRGFHRHLSTKY